MNIYLIRHGKSEPVIPGKSDRQRMLTQEGAKIVKSSAEYWKEFIKEFDYIITSPFIRAKQTAEIISKVFDFKKDIIEDNTLEPGCAIRNLIELANALDGNNIAFIGHQPDLGNHIEQLVSSKGLNLKFSAASIAGISFENKMELKKGVLIFLIPPLNIKG